MGRGNWQALRQCYSETLWIIHNFLLLWHSDHHKFQHNETVLSKQSELNQTSGARIRTGNLRYLRYLSNVRICFQVFEFDCSRGYSLFAQPIGGWLDWTFNYQLADISVNRNDWYILAVKKKKIIWKRFNSSYEQFWKKMKFMPKYYKICSVNGEKISKVSRVWLLACKNCAFSGKSLQHLIKVTHHGCHIVMHLCKEVMKGCSQ